MRGPNDSGGDPQLEAALFARWSEPAPTERIGGLTYSLWKVDRPLAARPPRFSRAFGLGTVGFVLVFLVVVRFVSDRIRAGDVLMAQVAPFAPFALFAVFFFLPLALIVVSNRRPPAGGEPLAPPPGIPSKAVCALAGPGDVGQWVGWLWFEGDRLHFRGAGFDFRLRREDFEGKNPLRSAIYSKEGAALRRPEGIGSHRMRLRLGRLVDGTFAADPKLWDALQGDLAVWESGAYSAEPSLFPPLRPVSETTLRLGWGHVVLPPLLMGGLLAGATLFLDLRPKDGSPGNPVGMAIAGALFGLMWPGILWSGQASVRAKARQVERALAQTDEAS